MPLEEAGEATRALADQYLASIRAEAGRRLTERQLDIIRFEDRLYARWREPLDLFDLILVLFQEATEIFDKENSSKAMETQGRYTAFCAADIQTALTLDGEPCMRLLQLRCSSVLLGQKPPNVTATGKS
jgi:NTP pyrophosphatase (non-canonical NTP hydrolase)